MGDEPGRDDAISRALLNETDPGVRGYVENLRSQIATIAARHGANARDVWNKEVQDRMSVDEMDEVNALFARIKAMSEKKIPSLDAIRMERELSEREVEAREALREVTEKFDRFSATVASDVLAMFLRAGLSVDAMRFLEGSGRFAGNLSRFKLTIALAEETAKHDPSAGKEILSRRFLSDISQTSAMFSDRQRLFLTAYDARLRLLTDEEFMEDFRFWSGRNRWDNMILMERLMIEVILRKFGKMESDRVVRSGGVLGDPTRAEAGDRIPNQMLRAEMQHSHGIDATEFLREAIEWVRDGTLLGRDQILDIAETAGRIGAFDVIAELEALPQMVVRPTDAHPTHREDIWLSVTTGCIKGKNFDAALEILRDDTKLFYVSISNVVGLLVEALLDADQVDRAKAAYGELYADPSHLLPARPYIAAMARRGADVLKSVKIELAMLRTDSRNSTIAVNVLNAAIATIGYTVAMKKRIAEYASKR